MDKTITALDEVQDGDIVTIRMRDEHDGEIEITGAVYPPAPGSEILSVGGWLVMFRSHVGDLNPSITAWSAMRPLPEPPDHGWLLYPRVRDGQGWNYAYREGPEDDWLVFDSPYDLPSHVGLRVPTDRLVEWTPVIEIETTRGRVTR